jgi:hypothetical protein
LLLPMFPALKCWATFNRPRSGTTFVSVARFAGSVSIVTVIQGWRPARLPLANIFHAFSVTK